MNINWLPRIDFKQKPNKRERLIFGVTVLVLCGGFFKAFVMSSHQAITKIELHIKNLEEERDRLNQKPIPIKKQDGAIEAPPHFVGTPKDLERAIEAATQPIRLQGIKIVKSTFGNHKPDSKDDPKKEASLAQKTAALTIVGSFPKIGNYLEYLERLPAPMIVDRLTLESGTNPSGDITTMIVGGFYAKK